jgi:L-histidine Nalpha-methyltransferase
MSSTANVLIHQSQFPENVRRDLLESLRTRRVNHKFHYDSVKQTQKWLALHQVYSPSRNDDNCMETYDRAFVEAAARIAAKRIHVIGLGCGGGQKDARLLKLLTQRHAEVFYTPSDVSMAMTLVARQAALELVPNRNLFPLVCDLATAGGLPALFAGPRGPRRLITFFGMIPNFEPSEILPKLASLVGPYDLLLFSANLAPGRDYDAGVKKILPQYDNPLTREWLLALPLDLGVERRDGILRFAVERGASGLKRVVARFHFRRRGEVHIESDCFKFRRGQNIRLFFSYRYTPELVRSKLAKHGLRVCDQWITQSDEEGVFLVRRA